MSILRRLNIMMMLFVASTMLVGCSMSGEKKKEEEKKEEKKDEKKDEKKEELMKDEVDKMND